MIFLILLYTIYSNLSFAELYRFQIPEMTKFEFEFRYIYIEIIEYMLKEKKNIDQKIKINKI